MVGWLVSFGVFGGGPLIFLRICFLPDDVDGLVGDKALALITVGMVTCPVCSNHCSVSGSFISYHAACMMDRAYGVSGFSVFRGFMWITHRA